MIDYSARHRQAPQVHPTSAAVLRQLLVDDANHPDSHAMIFCETHGYWHVSFTEGRNWWVAAEPSVRGNKLRNRLGEVLSSHSGYDRDWLTDRFSYQHSLGALADVNHLSEVKTVEDLCLVARDTVQRIQDSLHLFASERTAHTRPLSDAHDWPRAWQDIASIGLTSEHMDVAILADMLTPMLGLFRNCQQELVGHKCDAELLVARTLMERIKPVSIWCRRRLTLCVCTHLLELAKDSSHEIVLPETCARFCDYLDNSIIEDREISAEKPGSTYIQESRNILAMLRSAQTDTGEMRLANSSILLDACRELDESLVLVCRFNDVIISYGDHTVNLSYVGSPWVQASGDLWVAQVGDDHADYLPTMIYKLFDLDNHAALAIVPPAAGPHRDSWDSSPWLAAIKEHFDGSYFLEKMSHQDFNCPQCGVLNVVVADAPKNSKACISCGASIAGDAPRVFRDVLAFDLHDQSTGVKDVLAATEIFVNKVAALQRHLPCDLAPVSFDDHSFCVETIHGERSFPVRKAKIDHSLAEMTVDILKKDLMWAERNMFPVRT